MSNPRGNKSESEFDFAKIRSCSSHHVTPLSVEDSPIRFECTLRDVISVGGLPMGGAVVLLDVKFIYVEDDILVDGYISQDLIDSIGRMGGSMFSLTNEKIELRRP